MTFRQTGQANRWTVRSTVRKEGPTIRSNDRISALNDIQGLPDHRQLQAAGEKLPI